MQQARPGVLRTNPDQHWKDDDVWYFEVEKGGIFVLNDLYMYMFQWVTKEMMKHWQSDDNKVEDFYLHRLLQDGKQENLIWWRFTRRINDFTHYMCKMDWQNFGSYNTEVNFQGQKIKAQKAGLVIRVWWWVQWDPYNKWEKTFLGRIQKWFFTNLLHNEMEEHRDKCREIAKRMENELKTFFEITTNIAMPRPWFPEGGYKYKQVKPKEEDFKHMPKTNDQRVV